VGVLIRELTFGTKKVLQEQRSKYRIGTSTHKYIHPQDDIFYLDECHVFDRHHRSRILATSI
jgi:hypothetical protein